MAPSILYVSYDGMLEPLGQSQVLGYLDRLSVEFPIVLISFEKRADWADAPRREAARARILAAGIKWVPLRYHKRPTAPATAFDIAVGTMVVLWLGLRHRIKIVHARSYIPALMALPLRRLTGARLLFDMRGFWADERVDGNLWPAGGWLYRAAKRVERRLLLAADHVVTLTDASTAELRRLPYLAERMPPLDVIPTCADLERFCVYKRRDEPGFVLGHVGSVGTWYLFDELLLAFKVLLMRLPDARLLILNRGEHALIRERFRAMNLSEEHLELITADHAQVPESIARMSAGSAIIKPAFSKIASAPTKLAEYLGCGIPCLGNVGVGDMEAILEGERVGVALSGFSPVELATGVDRLIALTRDERLAARCVEVARRLFSLEAGVLAYKNIYAGLAER